MRDPATTCCGISRAMAAATAAALLALLLLAPAGASLAACGGSAGQSVAGGSSPGAAASSSPGAAVMPIGAGGAGEQPAAVRRDLAYAHVSPSEKLDLYLPAGGSAPFPVIVAIHGGGFMAGDKRDGQVAPMLLGLSRGYAVASIDYRLSGEAKFPAQIQDVKAAIRWLRANAGRYKLDPARIFHVHLRDYKHQAGKVVWAAVGDGEFDNLGQIRALLKDGYKQAFTLETHWRDPKGKTYSSATSLKALLKVIERV